MMFGVQVFRSEDLAGGTNRQLKAFRDTSPYILLLDAARGLRGRTTSKLEDETICLGGIIGFDVAPLLAIRNKEGNREEELERVCAARMKLLLSMVKIVPGIILFWESKRIRDSPWRWAPLSFLDKRAGVAMLAGDKAECTPNGLLGSYSGIQFRDKKLSGIEEGLRQLRLRFTYKYPEAGFDQFYRSWETLELRPSNASPHLGYSWYDCFSEKDKEFALIIHGERELEGVLVQILEIKENVIYAGYLSNIARVTLDDKSKSIESHVEGEFMGTRRWCIG